MRSLLIAMALLVAPTGTLAACASFEQVAPKSPRAALADAEIMFVGVIDVTSTLRQRGVLKPEETARLIQTFQTVSEALNLAHLLVATGDLVNANRTITETLATLSAVSLQLSLLAEANPVSAPPQPVASPTRFEI